MYARNIPAALCSAKIRGSITALGFLHHRFNDLLDKFALVGEVIGDHALADSRALGDLGQGSVRVSEFGDRIDCAFNQLRPPCSFDERATLLAI